MTAPAKEFISSVSKLEIEGQLRYVDESGRTPATVVSLSTEAQQTFECMSPVAQAAFADRLEPEIVSKVFARACPEAVGYQALEVIIVHEHEAIRPPTLSARQIIYRIPSPVVDPTRDEEPDYDAYDVVAERLNYHDLLFKVAERAVHIGHRGHYAKQVGRTLLGAGTLVDAVRREGSKTGRILSALSGSVLLMKTVLDQIDLNDRAEDLANEIVSLELDMYQTARYAIAGKLDEYTETEA